MPGTIQALTGQTLAQLNVNSFEDLLKYTPNVTFGNNGPGEGAIFMRGLSSGFAGGQSSATIASFPNVALYLDDQSMQFPARNVDIYPIDLDRIEVLEGPQGTLFGGGAEAGAVRYITNKPKLDKFEGSAEAQYGITSGGGENASGKVVLNIPLIEDKLAVRAALYDDRHGGYIDNVNSTFTRSNSDTGNYYFGIKPTNGLCNQSPAGGLGRRLHGRRQPAGEQLRPRRLGFQPADLPGRAGSRRCYKINSDWDVLLTESLQNMDAEGTCLRLPDRLGLPAARSLEAAAGDHASRPATTRTASRTPLVDGERQASAADQGHLHRRLHRPHDLQPGRLHQLLPHRRRHLL